MTINNLELCSFHQWYPRFAKNTIESIVIPIPIEVVEYLQADTLVLPSEAVFQRCPESTSSSSTWGDSEEDSQELTPPSFPEFSQELKDALHQLCGSVFVKLNWSAPVDAAWITSGKTLKCTNLEDIYLLLKSSELVARDLAHVSKALDDQPHFCVVLKRWQDVHPGSEFRCFVVHNKLVGISQRDCKAFYKHIVNSKFDIIEDIENFYHCKVKDYFPLQNYVFDVLRVGKDQVTLLDFSPFDGKFSKPILFSWAELRALSCASEPGDEIGGGVSSRPEFRFLAEEPGFQPDYYGVPRDAISLCETRSTLSLMKYITEQVKTQRTGDDSCSESDG